MEKQSYKVIRKYDKKEFKPWEISVNGYLDIMYVYENGDWMYVKDNKDYSVVLD
jgi:hypothetical protein